MKGARLTGPGDKSSCITSRHSRASHTRCPTSVPSPTWRAQQPTVLQLANLPISCSWTVGQESVAVIWPKGENPSSIVTAQVLLQLIIFTPSFQLIWGEKKMKYMFIWFRVQQKRVCEPLVNPVVLSAHVGTFRWDCMGEQVHTHTVKCTLKCLLKNGSVLLSVFVIICLHS